MDLDHFAPRGDRAVARGELGLPDEGRRIIGGVGRLKRAKRFAYLIRAMAMLRTRTIGLTWPSPAGDQIRATSSRWPTRSELGTGSTSLGSGPDVRRVHRAIDIFCLSSKCEALPYTLLEAMAVGLPVVGAQVGGVPEVIDHGTTGFLVPPRNPAASAAALQPLLDDGVLWDRMGRAARQRVKARFDQATCVARPIQLFRDMQVGGRPPREA